MVRDGQGKKQGRRMVRDGQGKEQGRRMVRDGQGKEQGRGVVRDGQGEKEQGRGMARGRSRGRRSMRTAGNGVFTPMRGHCILMPVVKARHAEHADAVEITWKD
ncbi:hypothetical protein ACOMHN_051375 [Nucella lapillus]